MFLFSVILLFKHQSIYLGVMKVPFLCFESYYLNSDLRLWLFLKHYEAKALQQNHVFPH